MKTSFVVTIFNEEGSIRSFLKSIAEQTVAPDEIIIVDAGSTDKTISKIKKWQKQLPIRLIIEPGINRSQGRNLAIKTTKNKIIAVSDAGCILNPNWLKEITNPLKKKSVFVVAGNYQPIATTSFQKSLAAYTCADIYQKNKNHFLPSSRSIAFKKLVWQKVGGYPKELNYCEDLVFDQKIKKSGFSFLFSPKAIVYWPQRKTITGAFRQFHRYAFGDGQVFFSQYQTHSKKIALIFFRYLLGLILFFLAIKHWSWQVVLFIVLLAYFAWPIIKTKKMLSGQALFITPFIQILADVAVMTGTLRGILENLKRKGYNYH